MIKMSKLEKLSVMRKNQVLFNEGIGNVNEDELKRMAGAGDVNPETSPATPTLVAVSLAVCPTTKCTTQCGK